MTTDTKNLLRSGPCDCGDPACPKCFGEPPEEIDGEAQGAQVRQTRDGIIANAARLLRIGIEDPRDAETVRQVVVALRGLADGLRASEDALLKRFQASERPAWADDIDGPLIDPDCKDGTKCGSCMGGPCEHGCHQNGASQ